MENDRRDDGGDRPRERNRDRDEYPRNGGRGRGRGGRDHANTNDGRNRSRSPRREQGGRRYRSRSPMGRDDRDRRGRGDRGGGRGGGRGDREGGRGDRRPDRDPRDFRSNREPPKGPRGAPPSGPRRDFNNQAGGPPKPPTGPRAAANPPENKDVEMEEQQPQRERPEGMDDETWEMAQVMGFARFKSTKNRKVPGNDKNWGVRKEKRMEARQYMNRQGGFNRPLSPGKG